MDMFVVEGGRPLYGKVAVSGAKNAALPIMACALASDGPTILKNVPRLIDVGTLSQLLESLGVTLAVIGGFLARSESAVDDVVAAAGDGSLRRTNDCCELYDKSQH